MENKKTFTVGNKKLEFLKWKEKVLSYDPFQDDEGCATRLSDKIVLSNGKSKKTCNNCYAPSKKNSYERVISEVFDGDFIENRFCEDCCNAMALFDSMGAGESWRDFEGKVPPVTFYEREKLFN